MKPCFEPDFFAVLFTVVVVFVVILLLYTLRIWRDSVIFKKLIELLSRTLLAHGPSLHFMKDNEKQLVDIIRDAIRKLERSENKMPAREVEAMLMSFIKVRNKTGPVLNANFRKLAEDAKFIFDEFPGHDLTKSNIIAAVDSSFIEPLSIADAVVNDDEIISNLEKNHPGEYPVK